ncbi:MAG: hypothetical protein L3J41_05145 [Melioribacteraceae bacterium]|nr:hypothetical protein [Melioribacteraceae bacterium]
MDKLIFIIALLLFNSNINAQDDSVLIDDSTKSAIEIYLLNEQSLYYNYQISNHLFWKIGVDFSSNFSKHEYRESFYSESEFGVKLNSQVFIRLFNTDFTNLFYGLGPSLVFFNEISKNKTKDYQEIKSTFEYGLINTLSAEIYFSKRIYSIIKYDYLITKGVESTELKGLKYSEYEITSWKRNYTIMNLSKIIIGIGIKF